MFLNTFVTTVAANEGIRAAGREVGVGVALPVGGRLRKNTGGKPGQIVNIFLRKIVQLA
jgi:hypothetical protein